MKKPTLYNRAARLLTLVACSALLASCYSDDEYALDPSASDGIATVRVGITSERVDETVTRAGTDDNAYEHEFMNHLCVLIVNESGTLVKKLGPDILNGIAAAQTGDLEEWTSEELDLPVGTYTIYAFANWSRLEDVTLNTLFSTVAENTDITTQLNSLAGLQLEDLASQITCRNGQEITANTVFIPMYGTEKVEVTETTTSISVGLDRLVSRVRLKLDLPDGLTLGEDANLTFSGVAPVTGLTTPLTLLEGITLAGDWNTLSYDFPLKDYSAEAGTISIPDFYVNETMLNAPFTVTLKTGNAVGVAEYTAQTDRIELPRNRIYPLTLQLKDYAPVITPTAWLSAIDAYPEEITTRVDGDTYYINGICVGAQFELACNAVSDGTNTFTPTSVTWKLINDDSSYMTSGVYVTSTTNNSVRGYISADDRYEDKSSLLQLDVAWSDGTNSYNRTYRVVVQDLLDMFDVEYSTTTRSSSVTERMLRPCWLEPETLILFQKK